MLSRSLAALVLALPALTAADVITGRPDAAPAGFEQWTSEIVLPSKNISGDGSWAAATAKAKAFVAQLTLDEKINVTTGTDIFNRCLGNTGTIPRLGWGGLCLHDSPLGVRVADFVSAFPAGINAATTWDKKLIYNRGKAIGQENRGKGVNIALGPMMNMGRVAAGGRNWEGFGSDPYLTGEAAVQTILGLQSVGVQGNAKHFIANEQEHFRGGSQAGQIQSSNIDDRTMHELYLWPFAESVNAGVATVMCSYNKINQTQACQNSKILNGLLKEELDFQGPIISDWAAAINGVQPALAGMDMNMPGFYAYGQGNQDEGNPSTAVNTWWGANLAQAVRNGSVPEWRIDDMVTRTFAAWYKLGQDTNYPAVNFAQVTQDTYYKGLLWNEHVNVQGDHYKVIREIGAASTVLLKNTKSALPLNINKLKRVGIFGSDAGPNPDGPNGCNDRGCDQGTLAMGWGSGTANFPYLIDPSAAINSFINANRPGKVVVESVLNDFNYGQVSGVARQSDTCLVFANADSGEGYITVDNNAGDRNNLTLWHAGDELIRRTAQQCANTIVVLHTVGPVIVESWIENPNVTAVLWAGLPGQETGNALVDVLFGAVNPSGRLPYTIAKQRTDYNADVVYTSTDTTPQITYSEGLNIDYRHFDAAGITPRFEFGFGLSYTTFTYSNLRIRAAGAAKRQETPTSTFRFSKTTIASSGAASASASATSFTIPESSAITLSSVVSSAQPVSSVLSSAASTLSSVSSRASSIASSVLSSASGSASRSASASGSSASGSASGSVSRSSSANATSTYSTPPAISSPAQTRPGGPASLYKTAYEVSFTLGNNGKVDGHEVAQLYLTFPESANEPPRVLRGFERVLVLAGGEEVVEFALRTKDISVWDVVSQKWKVPKGTFTVGVGSSSRKIRLSAEFTR